MVVVGIIDGMGGQRPVCQASRQSYDVTVREMKRSDDGQQPTKIIMKLGPVTPFNIRKNWSDGCRAHLPRDGLGLDGGDHFHNDECAGSGANLGPQFTQRGSTAEMQFFPLQA